MALFSFGQNDQAIKEKKAAQDKVAEKINQQRIKIVMKKDGKELKIDTVFNLPDEKMVKEKLDAMMKKLEKEGLLSDSDRVFFKNGKNFHWSMPKGGFAHAGPGMDYFIFEGDSGKSGHERRVISIGRGNRVELMGPDGGMMPPMPPHAKAFRFFGGDPFAMDPNDKDIVSYDRKDIGKGLEKITIVRKKRPEHEVQKRVEVRVESKADTKKEEAK